MSYANIKVCCRFRPRNELELKEENGVVKKIFTYDTQTVGVDEHKFNFDHVFGENSTQEQVFNIAALPVISDMLQGYNCTIFVYGQTSSGKTFSMTGDRENPGLSPRLLKKIFDHIYNSTDNTRFTIHVSYIEIYLEKIRDLLNPVNDNLKLRQNDQVWIQGVTEEYMSCYDDVMDCMRRGNSNRTVGETRMNQRSSRSHSVFMLTLEQYNPDKDIRIVSKLVLVDLAGSESVAKTGATGLLLKQAQHTNKSLTYLGIVIKALTENSKHIPYRDSKLTRILSDSLGGTSKTCLIVTCSPSIYNLTETISTLRFGTRVKTIKNRPRINIKSTDEYKQLLADAYKRIEELENGGGIVSTTDDLQEQLARKEHEIELLTEEYNHNITKKEEELKEKILENQKLKRELIIKSNGLSTKYIQGVMESRQELINVLEVALRNAEETIKSQRNDYEYMIRTLKTEINELRNSLYRFNGPMTRNVIIPVRKK